MNPKIRLIVGLVLLILVFAGGGWLFMSASSPPLGLTLFALVPLLIGGISAWMLGAKSASDGACIGVLGILAANALVVGLCLDGFVCVAMALPLTLSLGALGGCLAGQAAKYQVMQSRAAMLLLLPPAVFTWDLHAPIPIYEVHTAVEIAATPAQVWRHVVTFSNLPEARPWYFHTGLAYPLRARIEGSGPGATRYCEFSTGPFVEPIEIWDEARLLRFRVTQNPAPLEEWNPFGPVHPAHLHGYLISKRGQFQLTRLPNGHTQLAGTTWYQHGLFPAFYWRWWSDAIIHRIHLRVLEHVRHLSERRS